MWKKTKVRNEAIRKRFDELLKENPNMIYTEMYKIIGKETQLSYKTILSICNRHYL